MLCSRRCGLTCIDRPSSLQMVADPGSAVSTHTTGDRLFRVTARLGDTNARGCVDDVALLVFFEAARAVALRELGLPYDQIQARGVNALTIKARLTNHSCAQMEDPLVVRTSIGEAGRLRFSFVYEIRRETDDALVASGETLHILVDAGSGQPSRVPDWFYGALEPMRRRDPR
jgi:acyl-CoA thioester hydrolase